MGRRRQSSLAEDLMDLAALLPWWVGVGLALLSYRILHGLATEPLPGPLSAHPTAAQISAAVWQGLAATGQYIVPMLCLLGALLSALRRHQRRKLFDELAQAKATQGLLERQALRTTSALPAQEQAHAAVPHSAETAAAADGTATHAPAPPAPSQTAVSLETEDAPAPACPRCAKPMRLRVAGGGPHAGEFFWSCAGFPRDCQGTRTIQES